MNKIESWTFESKEIADKFNDHVREQLPWYEMVSDAVAYIVRNYLTEGELITDHGSSTGNMINKLLPLIEERNATIHAIEKSSSMCKKLNERFGNLNSSSVILENADICDFNFSESQVHIIFLTLMFIPVHKREKLLDVIKSKTKKGGVIIIVDKVLDHNGYFSTVIKRLGMQYKIQQGAKLEEVTQKEMSLAGVQIPIDKELVKDGKEFFRMGEFAGWVIEV
jgi:tRNA (cmo5U34)-methyltransferase